MHVCVCCDWYVMILIIIEEDSMVSGQIELSMIAHPCKISILEGVFTCPSPGSVAWFIKLFGVCLLLSMREGSM